MIIKMWKWFAEFFLGLADKSSAKYLGAIRTRVRVNNHIIMKCEQTAIKLQNENEVWQEILTKAGE